MKQNNYNEEREAKEIENWRNEHGEPDFDYLQSLAFPVELVEFVTPRTTLKISL